MATKDELIIKNTPIKKRRYEFYLNNGLFPYVDYDLEFLGEYPDDNQFAWVFTFEYEGVSDTRDIQIVTSASPTLENIYNAIILDENYIYLNSIGYLWVTYNFGVLHVKSRVSPTILHSEFAQYDDVAPLKLTNIVYTQDGIYKLKHAPSGWDDDEFKLERDMESFGVRRSFASKELKFVKDGRDYLYRTLRGGGINALCLMTVVENTPSGIVRNRFIGKIDFGTWQLTKLSFDVTVVDADFTDLVLSRADIDIDLFSEKTIDGAGVSATLDTKKVRIPSINILQVAEWRGSDYTTIFTGDHYMFVNKISFEFSEAKDVTYYGNNFFDLALEDYTGAKLIVSIKGRIKGDSSLADYTWNWYLSKWLSGSETVLFSDSVLGAGADEIEINVALDETFTIATDESLSLRGEIVNSFDNGTIQFDDILINLTKVNANLPQRDVTSVLYHEAFERLIYLYTGKNNRFYSTVLGRTDIGYAEDGIIGALTTGRWIRDNIGARLNITIPASIKDLFLSMRNMYFLGMGIEQIEGEEKVVIEHASHFFQSEVILDISDRINSVLIRRAINPDLIFNSIEVGYDSYEYRMLGGVYEYNTKSKFTTPIKVVDKNLDLVAPYRTDLSALIALISDSSANKDISGESDRFLLDTIRGGDEYIVRTNEGFEFVNNAGNKDVLINLNITPGRNVRRWGPYIRGFCDDYLSSLVVWQTSDKNTQLSSKETGIPEVVENSNIVISDLDPPYWKAEVLHSEFPEREQDIELIKQNPYGLIKVSADEYGWILSYQSKNKNKKSVLDLLVCNTKYITPTGAPVYPATIKIRKVVTNAEVDNTAFHVNVIGDNGTSYSNVGLSVDGSLTLTNVPYGTYTITEETESGYNLVSIVPSEITIDKDNLQFEVVVTNEKIERGGFGILYNQYALQNEKGICPDGYHLPTSDELWDLYGSYLTNPNDLVRTESRFWDGNSNNATNNSGFSAVGCGSRGGYDGIYYAFGLYQVIWSGDTGYYYVVVKTSSVFGSNYEGGANQNDGFSTRYVKDDLINDGTVLDYDGNIYNTIEVNGKIWTKENIKVTHYNDGTPIPLIADNTEWSEDTAGAMCYPNNDPLNV